MNLASSSAATSRLKPCSLTSCIPLLTGDIVVNRIVTTLTGCGVSILLALLPPYYWGNEPRLAQDLLAEAKVAVVKGLGILISSNEDKASALVAERDSFERIATGKCANMTAHLADATGLQFLPFCKNDPALSKLVDELAITLSMIESWLARGAELAKNDDFVAEFAEGRSAYLDAAIFITELDPSAELPAHKKSRVKELGLSAEVSFEGPLSNELPDVDFFMAVACRIISHFSDSDATLSEIRGDHWSLGTPGRTPQA